MKKFGEYLYDKDVLRDLVELPRDIFLDKYPNVDYDSAKEGLIKMLTDKD